MPLRDKRATAQRRELPIAPLAEILGRDGLDAELLVRLCNPAPEMLVIAVGAALPELAEELARFGRILRHEQRACRRGVDVPVVARVDGLVLVDPDLKNARPTNERVA